jgi:drug/metabolite transporter (DMT)-like permease
MFAGLLILVGSLFEEVAESIGKKQVEKAKQNVYSLGFLNYFWVTIFFLVTIIFGADFTFSTASLPTFIPRVILEIILAHIMVVGIINAERSSFSYVRLITIPLVLIIEIALGNSMNSYQILGVILMFAGLFLLLFRNTKSRAGFWPVAIGAVIAAITLSLFKYNITYFNSVAAEQFIITSVIVMYFLIASKLKSKPINLSLLIKPKTGVQAISSGLETMLVSFAFYFAPTSIITVLKRTTAMFWAVIFGRRYFREEALLRKVLAGILIATGLILILV